MNNFNEDLNYTRLPEINDSQRQELEIRVQNARRDIETVDRNLEQLKQNFPEQFDKLQSTNPDLFEKIDEAGLIMTQNADNLSNDELTNRINQYNYIAGIINTKLDDLTNLEQGNIAGTIENLAQENNYEEVAANINPEQVAELKEYTEQVLEELFPESYVSRAVRIVSGEYNDNYNYETGEYGQLEDWQKIAIAPAEGIERTVRGIFGLANPQTYTDLYNGLSYLGNMTTEDAENIYNLIKEIYNQSTTTDKVSKIIAVAVSVTFLAGLVSKLPKIPASIKYIVDSATTLSINTNLILSLPAASLSGLFLSKIETDDIYHG